ncbi:unnamed protein product [Caenorhabditis brenneri]
MWISFKVISTEDLYRDTNQQICRQLYLPRMTLVGFEEEIRRVSGSTKPMVIVSGLFYWHEMDLGTLDDNSSFLILESEDSLIVSYVEEGENGFGKAIEAIKHELNLN